MKRTLEPHELIERSIIKKFRKPIWRRFTKAIREYELVKDGDKIAVCISGGKDSMLMAKLFQELNVKPEIEAFDPGMIANAAYYLKKGVLKAPLHFQFCMGCANGIPGSVKNLVFMKETMDQLCPGSTWSTFGVGHSAMEIMYAAVALGGHIRVGMEDNVMYSKGVLADSNAQFVERAARVIREYGNEVATPAEAREILGLK